MNKLDLNFVNRYAKQSYDGSTKVRSSNRKFIYSRYRQSTVSNCDGDVDGFISSCAFTPDDQCLLLGCNFGKVRIVNKYNDTLIAQKKVHPRYLNLLVPHKSGELLLTSGINSSFDYESFLWYIKNDFEKQFKLNDCHYAEFTHAQDKVIGTSEETAKLYDLNSGQVIHEYKPTVSDLYYGNKAALDPYDELLLTYGVLFDVRSGKEVHRFGKIANAGINGAFHSNRLEIIRSSGVWDLRTFHLLQTVKSLEYCTVKFNNYGDVIFGLYNIACSPNDFEVIDASDYSKIATINVSRCILSLAINPTDTQISVATDTSSIVEDIVGIDYRADVCLYDIGMVQHEEEMID